MNIKTIYMVFAGLLLLYSEVLPGADAPAEPSVSDQYFHSLLAGYSGTSANAAIVAGSASRLADTNPQESKLLEALGIALVEEASSVEKEFKASIHIFTEKQVRLFLVSSKDADDCLKRAKKILAELRAAHPERPENSRP